MLSRWAAAVAVVLLPAALPGPAHAAAGEPRPPQAHPAGLAASTAPRTPPPGAATRPQPDDDTSDPDRPVRIDVGRLEPRTLTPESTVTVTGTLTNTGDQAISDLAVRLQRGERLTSRAALAIEADQNPSTTVLATFQDVPGELAPGDSLPFSYSVPASDLQIDRDGVYPVLLNVNATTDGLRRRVAELSSYLVQQPVVPDVRTTVAWLWPLVEESSRNAAGEIVDGDLARSVGSGGRLDRALAVVERLPRSAPTEGAAAVPLLPVALAVDPALVEELVLMAAGPYAVAGVEDDGRGTEAARAFLDRLRAAAAVHPVVALPYGDVDIDALSAAGLTDVVTRSLPGTAEGTAQDPPGRPPAAIGAEDAAPSPSPSPGPDAESGEGDAAEGGAPAGEPAAEPAAPAESTAAPTGTPDAAAADGAPAGAGARILADALGVVPRTDLAWAPGGSLREDSVATLRGGGVRHTVLGPAGVSDSEEALGLDPGTAGARVSVDSASGELDVLVADAVLGTVAAEAEEWGGGPRLAEQRYLAELAVIGLQAPAGSRPTVLVAPPRAVDAGPDGAGAMMADTAGLPWLQPVSLDGLLVQDAVVDGGELVDPPDAVRLGTAGLADVAAAEQLRDDLAGAVVDDPATALQSVDAAIARTTSVEHRDEPLVFGEAAADLRATVDGLLDRVTLLAPADGTYSLASEDAPLLLTVVNDLPFAVEVLLDLRSRGSGGFSVDDVGPQVLAPGERTTLQVPTEVRQSGRFAVTAGLSTPGGRPLGETVRLQVRSNAYGTLSLLITGGAFALLGLLFLRRLVRFLLKRRAAAAGGAQGAPEGALSPVPPARSPV
ncbi:DUF6049 family protein [Geodermatophilus sp. YIM 151500]|uniref:DUF6049 family protein n=1 Tax=Geodermatophilus sp. YIM 151500 TaxID=2984531 RepID=UPI0021E3842B|nr:DUF6049 family protein [Geodermatophilus sp. YIM 151500]MCV2491271.1 DUF6049 family protein [Geodermatophilus sp. YIM 151500]